MRLWPGDLKALHSLDSTPLPWWQPFDSEIVCAVHRLAFDTLLNWLNNRAQSLALLTGRGRPLRFVPQNQLPDPIAYESWIAQTGNVPTRDNLHDRYNALMWLTFPKTKAQLNAIQASEIDRLGMGGARGPVRDAATLWDENLVIIIGQQDTDKLQMALDSRDWFGLFWHYRSRWHRDWHVVPFGHALLEKLAAPYKAITGHAIVVSAKALEISMLDTHLSCRIGPQMSTAMFRPLPVMGVPMWDATNQLLDFYEDPKVFRTTNPS